MSFDDDEPINVANQQDVSGEESEIFLAGKTKAIIINKREAPLEESKFKVMVQLTGAGSGSGRPGVDLVTVLDVSGSMEGEKLEKLKTAMQFVIKKLSPIDRLSVVTFHRDSEKKCPLRQITEDSQPEIENLVNALVAGGGTNIAAGLETALKVLNGRRLTSGRVVGIMLMSDGQQSRGTPDAAKVPVGNVPVHTFGLGADHDPTVLKAIADNSVGGTFSAVQNQDNLSIAFSQCLAGLLTVVVQDLKLTITQKKSKIEAVSAGNYPQSKDDAAGSVTVSFGDLYEEELRKVMVDLLLPAANSRAGADILRITYTYKGTGVNVFKANPIVVGIVRTGGGSAEREREEVVVEENRLRTAQMMKDARQMADKNNLDAAQSILVDAQNKLEDVDVDNPLIKMLKSEVRQLVTLMQSEDIYKKQGRPFALSSETSHDRQRFAARGDDVEELRLFATPRMDTYLEQAKSFDEDPSQPLPTADEDVKQALAADPLSAIVGPLSYYIQTAIESLKAIDSIINRKP